MPGEGPGAGEMNVAQACMEGLNREQDTSLMVLQSPWVNLRYGWCRVTWEPKEVTSAGPGEEESEIKCPG